MKALQIVVTSFLLFVPGLRTQDRSPREYFEEMKNSGAFMHALTDVKGEKHSAPDPGYACFAEKNPMADRNGIFFTFEAMGYDKYYAEAHQVLLTYADQEKKREALATIENAHNRQPYVGLLTDDFMSLLPADAAAFYRKGGQELDLSLYIEGVKSWTVSLHRFRVDDKWDSVDQKMNFAIEPSTMRFLWSVQGDKPQMINGRCEKIYKDSQ